MGEIRWNLSLGLPICDLNVASHLVIVSFFWVIVSFRGLIVTFSGVIVSFKAVIVSFSSVIMTIVEFDQSKQLMPLYSKYK